MNCNAYIDCFLMVNRTSVWHLFIRPFERLEAVVSALWGTELKLPPVFCFVLFFLSSLSVSAAIQLSLYLPFVSLTMQVLLSLIWSGHFRSYTTKTSPICMHVNEVSLVPKLSSAFFKRFSSSCCEVLIIFSQRERRHVIWCVDENRLSFGLCYIRGKIRGSVKQETIYDRNIRQSGRNAPPQVGSV